jgi:hypothetical protein
MICETCQGTGRRAMRPCIDCGGGGITYCCDGLQAQPEQIGTISEEVARAAADLRACAPHVEAPLERFALRLQTAWAQQRGYTIAPDGSSIRCHRCGRTSYHREDVAHRYCGFCKRFHEDG